jgi:D-amino-acid dehydrogenase
VFDRGAIGGACSFGNAGYISPSHVIPLAAPGVVTQGLRWLLDPDSPFYVRPRLDLYLLRWLWRFARTATSEHVRRSAPLLADLGLRSAAQYAALAERLDFGFERSGLLMLHRSPDANRALVEHARRAGLEVDELNADAVQALEPAAAPGLSGVYFPQDAVLDPEHMTSALHRQLAAEGMRFVPHTAVTGFSVREDRIHALETSDGEWTADEVVLAAGAWSPELGRGLGLRLPVQPGKGYSVTITPDGPAPRLPVLLTEAKVAVTPLPGGRLRFAGTLELAGLDASVNERRVRAILRAVPAYLRLGSIEADPGEAWVGFRPCTPDGLPLIGRPASLRNLTVATGHAMLGITLAPATGDLVAAFVTGAPPPFDPMPFRVDRFG